MHVDDYVRGGMSPREARRLAHIKLGGLQQTKEEYRRRRGIPVIDDLGRDLKYGVRAMRKSPAFTLVSILSLAFGVGVNATVFGFVNALMLRPLPLPNHAELVRIQDDNVPTYSDYLAFDERGVDFQGLAAYDFDSFQLTAGDSSVRADAVLVSGNYFNVLGVKPALGRAFSPEEGAQTGAATVAVISHGLWRRRFGADPGVVGRTFRLCQRRQPPAREGGGAAA